MRRVLAPGLAIGRLVRKHMGYGLIGSEWAASIHDFYRQHLNPYLHFHRPCGFATVTVNERGKRRRSYPPDDYRTPYEKLTSLKKWRGYLKPDVTAASLHELATRHSDTEAATRMQAAKIPLLTAARSRQDSLAHRGTIAKRSRRCSAAFLDC